MKPPILVRDPKSPYLYVAYTTSDGRRLKTSTGQTEESKAWEVWNAKSAVEREISTGGRPTEKRLREIINEVLGRLGENKLRSDPTVKEQLDTWIANKRGSVAESTLTAYRQTKDTFLDFLGPRANRSVRLLTKGDVIEFRNHLSNEGRRSSTVNKLVRLYLKDAFKDAVSDGLIDRNPFNVDALKGTKVKKGRFTVEQVVRLVKAAEGTDWEGAILLGYGSGARLQDIANMRWSAIDSDNGLLTFVQGKIGKETVIGLHPDFEDWIARQSPSDDPGGYLFPTLANRATGARNGLSAGFSRIVEKAGIEVGILRERNGKGRELHSLSFHSFRHGAASAIFNQAALQDVVRRVTGHAERGAVAGYIREDVEMLKAATQLIPRLPKGD